MKYVLILFLPARVAVGATVGGGSCSERVEPISIENSRPTLSRSRFAIHRSCSYSLWGVDRWFPVQSVGGSVEAVWPPERTVCPLGTRCGSDGMHLPDNPWTHPSWVGFETRLEPAD